jgi:hypothetical protein
MKTSNVIPKYRFTINFFKKDEKVYKDLMKYVNSRKQEIGNAFKSPVIIEALRQFLHEEKTNN